MASQVESLLFLVIVYAIIMVHFENNLIGLMRHPQLITCVMLGFFNVCQP